ncbi:MAG: serine hydrolase domain-containing protein [Sphaerochaetaceae bacterium]|jgi:CubicO group peptidase (beta-lactamase class C family)|nr:serine hydrolase domain-containing protein [Sphaerochaetaceae bacterium]
MVKDSWCKRVLPILVLIVVLPGVLNAQNNFNEDIRQRANELATVIVEDLGAYSIQFALMSRGEIIVSNVVTNSHTIHHMPYDNQTYYGIGSMSKMFPTVAIMLLADQGIIDLDETVATYLPDFTMADERYTEITVRMLLNHSSGLLGSYLSNLGTYDNPDTFHRDQLLRELATQPLKADPGSFSAYCNNGFSLLELIVEQMSALSFSECIRISISDVLGMINTKTPQDDFDLGKLSKTYRYGSETPPEMLNSIGAGGMYSTAQDICRFGQIFMDDPGSPDARQFLSDEAKSSLKYKEYLLGIWPEQEASMFGFGLGWDSVDMYPFSQYGIQALVKGGDTNLYHSSMIVLPEYNLVFAALSSGGSSVLNLLMGQEVLLQTLLLMGIIDEILPPYQIEIPFPADMPQHFTEFSGLYANTTCVKRMTVRADGTLTAVSLTNEKVPQELYRYTDRGVFIDETGRKQLRFINHDTGKIFIHMVQIVEVPNLGTNVMTSYEYEKIELRAVSEEAQKAWNERNGWYYVVNELPSSQSYHLLDATRVRVSSHEDLPGFTGTLRILDEQVAINEVQLPGFAGRDNELYRIVYSNGKELLSMVGSLFINEREMEKLPDSRFFAVSIPCEGTAHWFVLEPQHAGKIMTVRLPEGSAYAVYDAQECIHFSTADGNLPVTLPKKGNVVFIGSDPADLIGVFLR